MKRVIVVRSMRSDVGVHSSRPLMGPDVTSARAPDERPLALEPLGELLVLVGGGEGSHGLAHAPAALKDAPALSSGARLGAGVAQGRAELLDVAFVHGACIARSRRG